MPDIQDRTPSNEPAIFATIHFRGRQRPNGYTAKEIAAMNELANKPKDT